MQFLTATDTNRKKFLIDLLHLDEYVILFEIFKEASRESSNKVIELSSEINTIDKWLNTNKLDSTNILPMLNLEINTEEEEKQFRSLSVELENISEKNKKILTNNQYKELLSKINIDEINSIQVSEKESYDEYQKEVGKIDGEIRASRTLLNKLEKLEDVCPTCEQKVDAEFKSNLVAEELAKIASMNIRKRTNEKLITRIKTNNSLFDKKQKTQKEWEDLYRNIDHTLEITPINKEELEEKIHEVGLKLTNAKRELEKINK